MTDEQKSPEVPVEKSPAEAQPALDALKPEEDPSDKKQKRWSRKNSRADSSNIADKNVLDALDLHDLIRKNNGTDVDLQFYFKGKLLPQNTCFFEVHQQANKEKKKQVVKPQDMPKFDKNNPSSLFNHLMASMRRGDQEPGQGMITIYFRLVEKSPSSSQIRRDSLADFANRRERTKSQAADLVSV